MLEQYGLNFKYLVLVLYLTKYKSKKDLQMFAFWNLDGRIGHNSQQQYMVFSSSSNSSLHRRESL